MDRQDDLGERRTVRCSTRNMGSRTNGAVMMSGQVAVMVKAAQHDRQEHHQHQADSEPATPTHQPSIGMGRTGKGQGTHGHNYELIPHVLSNGTCSPFQVHTGKDPEYLPVLLNYYIWFAYCPWTE